MPHIYLFMISILIPIYNFDVRNYVQELYLQAFSLNIAYEILLVDDASDKKYQLQNKNLISFSGVQYIQLQTNIGRSKIRNYLAKKAKYNYLLFTDCDSEVPDKFFVKKYIEQCKNETVVCGGTIYKYKKPENQEQFLRWYYGTNRESTSYIERNKYPNRSFMTGNFLISKSILNKIRFDEKITRYGHEDTLFGYELKKLGIKINHINNPLIHIGIETSEIFIEKTKISVENLKYITEKYNYPDLYKDIKLLKVYKKISFLRPLVKIVFIISKKLIERNLKSKKPKLFLFDFYKLGLISRNKV